jgi:uncharacterized protein (TIGR04255 family)
MIPFAPGRGVPITEFLRVGVAFGGDTVRDFGKFYLAAEFPSASGSLTIQVGSGNDEQQEKTLILDFDFAKTENLVVRDVHRYLDESHADTKRLFESLLTDEYRTYLRGEVVA